MVLSLCPIAFTIKNWLYVFYAKAATYSIKRMAVIPRKKLFEIFKKHYLQNPYQNISAVESTFNKITGIDFRTFPGRKFPSRFSFVFLWHFSASSVRSNVNFVIDKTTGFLKIILRDLVFGTFSKKNLW